MADTIEDIQHTMHMEQDEDHFKQSSNSLELLEQLEIFKNYCETYNRDFEEELRILKDEL